MSLASEIYVREIRDASGDNCWYLELRTNAGPERIRSALAAVGLGGYVQEIRECRGEDLRRGGRCGVLLRGDVTLAEIRQAVHRL